MASPQAPRPKVVKTVREIGTRLEPFIDDWLIERMDGMSLRLHQPVAKEIAFRFDRPWEGMASTFVRVMKDGDIYRNWYRAGADRNQAAAYAESADGIHWERPNLGLVEYEGTTNNNIVLRDDGIENLAVFRDDNPSAPDDERYKAIAKGPKIDGRATIRALTSPDGFRWNVIDVDPILVAPDDGWPMFDSTNVAFWDEVQEQYVAYMRGWFPSKDRVSSDHRSGVRSIRRSVSPDFRSWTTPEFIDLGDSEPEHLYTNAATPYFRAPHIYLMFPRRFVVGRKLREDWPYDGLSDSVFMSSRDGVHWDRRFMEPLIPTGRDIDDWTDRSTTPGVGLVPTGPDEMSIYYKEHNQLPTVRMRRGVFRTDGIVSLYSTYSGGEFVTQPLIFEGDELVLNYATSAAGSVRVEMQDIQGVQIPGRALADCDEIYGDDIERVVRWRGSANVGELAGRPVRLRVVSVNYADFYSVQFRRSH